MYYKAKQLLKKYIPKAVFTRLVNYYHWLEALVANVRFGFPGRSAQVVMVTGTNGKTTTVALLTSILQAAGYRVGVSSTAFYQIGDTVIINDRNRTVDDVYQQQALLARMKRAKCDFIVLEVTSQALAQYRTWGIPCDAAVMTNLTQDHLDYHKTMENYAAAKGKLFARSPRLIVLNSDDEWYEFYNKYSARDRKVSYGTGAAATARIAGVALRADGSDIKLQVEGGVELNLRTHLAGKFNAYNAAAAATTAHFLQLDPEHIEQGIANLAEVPGRMQAVNEGQRFKVFIDYAHTPDALKNLLETLRGITKGKVWLVFGATGDRDKTKRPIMGGIAADLADKIVVTDEEPYNEDPASIRAEIIDGITKAGGKAKTKEIADRREAMRHAFSLAHVGDVVAVTGMGHEVFRIVGGQRQPWSDAAVASAILRKEP